MGIHGGQYYLFGLALLILLLPCLINISNLVANASTFTNIATDQSALIALKSQLHLNPSHILSTNWSDSTPVCTWIGVSCGSRHHRVVALDISEMDVGGKLPPEIGNLSFIRSINLSFNSFHGSLPQEMVGLRRLQVIHLNSNNFEGNVPSWFQSLPQLTELHLRNNSFDGELPKSIANISKLEFLGLSYNPLHGEIPKGIGSSNTLRALGLQYNQLSGVLPMELFNISSLEILALIGNSFTGDLPADLCRGGASRLQELYLSENELGGQIPSTISECTQLSVIAMYSNKFTGRIPEVISNISGLQELNLRSNQLTAVLDLSMNQLSGIIPSSIGDMQNLQILSLAYNKFSGTIPESMGKNMFSLESLDLSHNNLSGNIPLSFESIRNLTDFDVSFNVLNGRIPSGGPFEQFGAQSFISNGGLCGDLRYGVSPCPSKKVDGRKRRKVIFGVVFAVIGAAALAFLIIFVTVRFTKYQRKKASKVQGDASIAMTPLRVSYYDIRNATEGFNDSHLVGTGGSSSVYKGIIQSAGVVAIKVLNLQLERACTSFIAECEVLRSLRHRNLCKVIGVCSNESFKALILEYMPNGSLERWLYSEDCFLDISQRVGIMIDVACALEYLHHGYSTKVVHCDVKPSNVLLDEDMVAHLSDFGITKLLSFDGDGFVQTNTLATLGYIAPEYGSEGLVSAGCDVYSYGIMMMEVFTRMKPSDEKFVGDLNLRKVVYDSWPNEIMRIIDPNLLRLEEDYSARKLECLSSIMELALSCSMESPNERLSMKDVVVRLKNIKLRFQGRRS